MASVTMVEFNKEVRHKLQPKTGPYGSIWHAVGYKVATIYSAFS